MARAYTKVGEKVAAAKFGIQATLILSAMSETEPRTVTAITNAIKDRLVTRQDPERVTAFYVSTWKKKGIVKLHEVNDAGQVQEAPAERPTNLHIVQPTEPPPTEVQEGTDGLPNLSGMKLSLAVLEVLKFRGGHGTADQVVATLNQHGYEFKLNQVNSALQALEARKSVEKREDDEFHVV